MDYLLYLLFLGMALGTAFALGWHYGAERERKLRQRWHSVSELQQTYAHPRWNVSAEEMVDVRPYNGHETKP